MLRYLKEQTKLIHNQVEKDNLAKHILNHTITLNQYKQLLINNYNAYKSVEQVLVKSKNLACNSLKPYLNFNKSDSLHKDLLQFENENIEIKLSNFRIENQAHLIGALYVIQGSMLGSLLIAKNIPKCESIKKITFHNFFDQYKHKNRVNLWKEFCEIVNKKTFTEVQKKSAGYKAQQVFKIFSND